MNVVTVTNSEQNMPQMYQLLLRHNTLAVSDADKCYRYYQMVFSDRGSFPGFIRFAAAENVQRDLALYGSYLFADLSFLCAHPSCSGSGVLSAAHLVVDSKEGRRCPLAVCCSLLSGCHFGNDKTFSL